MFYIFSRPDICMRSAPNYPYVLDTIVCYLPTLQNLALLNQDEHMPSWSSDHNFHLGTTFVWTELTRFAQWEGAIGMHSIVSRGKASTPSCAPSFWSHTVQLWVGHFCWVLLLSWVTGVSLSDKLSCVDGASGGIPSGAQQSRSQRSWYFVLRWLIDDVAHHATSGGPLLLSAPLERDNKNVILRWIWICRGVIHL